ncbi:hypothetical protein ACRE_013510 [Hapsidospora chrysogenum ATCC 11550]|uniref:Uncharacterized protein n=1 Tax=Hapsidospora chrysogenum (strain ATCC 11550 / CBS 779.69 / DSM 880 / IAM 14645 / JCM 23072 / IMI 49137) TaxID=857340 RepID=A0A086TEN0_HAPC1|nr:hypothetical protein ACRE_013510 [Hapsidospora chrysogenum ATCC 11550]
MAQGQVLLADPPGIHATNMSEEDLRAIQQYDRIVQLRDTILSGEHPTIKLPPGVRPTARSASYTKTSAPSPSGQGALSQDQQRPSFGRSGALDTQPSGVEKRKYGSGSTEINPILLEKSDELVRAEFQLQRQRLERALKEEVEQRRGLKQEKAEPLADHDLTDVLSRALALVQTTTASAPVDGPLTANDEAASDSFDDNTFYSSRHDTPESNLTSRGPNLSDEPQRPVVPEAQPAPQPEAIHTLPHSASGHTPRHQTSAGYEGTQVASSRLDTNSMAAATERGQFYVPGLNNYTSAAALSGQSSQTNTSGEQSQSEDSGAPYVAQVGDHGVRNARQHLDDAYIDTHPPSPLVQTHDLAPVAPQPAPAPSHAVEQLANAAGESTGAMRGAPAQVAALRNEPIAVNSPESSPQSGKGSERKKGKKKKRKADRQGPEEVMPYIKPEPRSPSPMTAPNFIRPSKRQKKLQRQANEPEQEVVALTNDSPRQYEPQPYTVEPVPYSAPPAASPVVVGSGYNGQFADDGRLPDGAYIRRQASPPRYIQHPPSAAYPRPQSHVVADGGYRDAPRAYREPYDGGRMSTRPEAEPYVGQPMPPPTRIIVDSFGREYIEPPRPTMRQSVAPVSSYGTEIVYERPPPRAVSRHPGPATYDDSRSVVYTRASSAYPGPRRVVTQPEYASQEFRDDRPREFSVRPAIPPGEYMQVMPPPERQQPGLGTREYGTRAPSVRPMEAVRYEVPQDYGRMQSMRPEAPGQDYAAAGRREGHREPAPPYEMEYGPRPIEQPVYAQGYPGRPVERYYDAQPARPGENIAFIERPRGATQDIVYANDGRGEMYR